MGAATETAMRPLNASAANAQRPQNAAPAAPAASKSGGAGLRIVKFFVAAALIPACVGMALGINDHFSTLMTRVNVMVFGPNTLMKWFFGGGIGFGIFAILLWRPVVLYVFGHELVHAFATWLCLGKVSNLTASASGGQVTTSKSNTFIRLAPYCVPFYALIVAAAYLCLDTWWRPLGSYTHIVAAMLGFFYTFHIGFTLWSLRRDQPDLKPDGWLFSLVIIYLANAAVFVLVLGFLFNGNARGSWSALRDSSILGWQHTQHIYHNLIAFVEQTVNGRG
jgi:hypothetical protein